VTGIISGGIRVGGLIGGAYFAETKVYNNNVDVIANGDDSVGGLIGTAMLSEIFKNYSFGDVTGSENVGGLIGLAFAGIGNDRGYIENNFSRANVSGYSSIGGLVGYGLRPLINNCYATGSVDGSINLGGLVGTVVPFHIQGSEIYGALIANSFYDIYTTGPMPLAGYIHSFGVEIFNSMGKTTDEMKTASTYTDAGWDFETIWDIEPTINEGYPFFQTLPVSDADITILPTTAKLLGNYPNPFNPETTIRFNVSKESHVTIDIYNIKGQKVRSLENSFRVAGEHGVVWNGANDNGVFVGSGIYFYRMKISDFVQARKMILLK
jgi:hypothetical protein